MTTRVEQLITALQLQPHPEGGWFCEVFRASASVQPADGRPPRQALTSIYFLLEAGQSSCWHRVASDEVWVHLEGVALDLWLWDAASNAARCSVLGRVDVADPSRQQPQRTVPAGIWQAAAPQQVQGASDGYTLVACMVGPGFDFADFAMLDAGSAEAARLRQAWPQLDRFMPV